MDFDEVLDEVGSFGLYQKIVICLVLLPAALPCAFHAYSQLFIAATPQHWCRIPELDPWLHDHRDLIKNLSIPLEFRDGNQQYSECSMYKRNYEDIARYLDRKSPIELSFEYILDEINDTVGQIEIIECQNGWSYDKSMYPITIVSQWDVVCQDNFNITLALVIFGIGGLIGNYIFGYLQDMWGRKPSFYAYLILEIFACAISAFAWNFYSWLGMRFIVGLTVPAILASPYVLAIELVGPDKRVFCTIVSNIAYSIGLVMLAGIVYFVRDWKFLSLAVSLPLLLLFSCFFIMPESPRWLVAVGEHERAAKILKNMAKLNGKNVPYNYEIYIQQILNNVNLSQNDSATNTLEYESYGILDLFRTKNMFRKTMIITLIWFANTSVYVGLSYYAPALGGDEIWNFFLAGAVELPTYIFLWPALNLFGRRWILCLTMLIGGVACIATVLFQDNQSVMLILYCIGKMGISSAYVVLPLQASELYPTVVRGLGMSFSSVVAMIGPIVIPIINHMGGRILVLPIIVMGGLLTVGGLASLFLPETKGRTLPQTLSDGEKVPLKNPFYFCCCFYNDNYKLKERKVTYYKQNPKLVCDVCRIEKSSIHNF